MHPPHPPLWIRHCTWSFGSDATVLDDYALTTTTTTNRQFSNVHISALYSRTGWAYIASFVSNYMHRFSAVATDRIAAEASPILQRISILQYMHIA